MRTEESGRVRFGTFELDLATGGLSRAGVPVRLSAQPAAVLVQLVESAGMVVTRDEIGRRLWHDRWEEFEAGINTCIAQIRSVLGDHATSPVYIETVPRRGYRFIAPVEALARAEAFAVPGTANRAVGGPNGASSTHPFTVRHEPRPRARRLAPAAFVVLLFSVGGLAALRSGRAEPASRIMLAVLPFEVLDADSSASHVSAGLTEELTYRLANLEPERLGVIARTSAAKFSHAAVAEIGKNLGVDYVVSGAVRSGTDRMRITVQLLRTSDESHLWADAFDRSLADVLDTQRDIAHRVSNALSLQLASAVPVHGDAPVSAARMPTLEARWLLDGGVTEKRSRARVLLDSAIAVDSTYAPAWSSLARLHVSGSGGVGSARLARAAAERAVTLERNNIESRLILANLRYQNDWDWDGAASDFERALSIATGQASVHHAYALFLAARGETAKARRHIEVAMRLDPVSTLVIGDAAWVHYHTRDFDEAERLAERVLSLDEHNLAALSTLANIAAVRGDRASSVDYGIRLAGAIRASGGQTGTTAAKADFEQFWNSWIAWWRSNSRGSLQAYQVAVGFSHLEQSDSAIASLEKGAQPGEGGMTTIAVDPAFDRLRGDARFRAVAARIAPAGLH